MAALGGLRPPGHPSDPGQTLPAEPGVPPSVGFGNGLRPSRSRAIEDLGFLGLTVLLFFGTAMPGGL
uniref:Uncharacterized protein n=1 Tax=Oryza sativa subsp. japonica TaxID=39947 RepID=Q84YW2_ORYSJ|nr:hypothetical protein [Oryza sativa Japonica Group]